MKVASSREEPTNPVLLLRPVTPLQLGEALGKKPFFAIQDLMELDYFASLRTDLDDDCIATYAKALNFAYQIRDSK